MTLPLSLFLYAPAGHLDTTYIFKLLPDTHSISKIALLFTWMQILQHAIQRGFAVQQPRQEAVTYLKYIIN